MAEKRQKKKQGRGRGPIAIPGNNASQIKNSQPNKSVLSLLIRKDDSSWLQALRVFIFLSGWLASLFLGLLDLPAKIVSFTSNAPKASEVISAWVWSYKNFTGRFSSDPSSWRERNLIGSDEKQLDVGEIQLEINYDGDGKFSGEIFSKEMEAGLFPWSRVMIDGEVDVFGVFTGEVWDIVGNQRAVYSSFKIRVDDLQKGTLRVVPLHKGDGIFSGEVVVWPTDFKMAGGARGKKFDEMLKESWQRYKNQGGAVKRE